VGDDPLKTAIDLIRSGRFQSAQEILQPILKADVHNIPAWFWYIETCQTMDQRIQILEACSICNPDNSQVRSALEALKKQQPHPVEDSKVEATPLFDGPKAMDRGAGPTETRSRPAKPAAEGKRGEEKPGAGTPLKKRRPVGVIFMWLFAGVLIIGFAYLAFSLIRSMPADAAPHHFTQPVEYYVYVPKGYTASRAWPLFIGIHGSGGTGLDCWNLWQPYAEREGFILLCPSIPDQGGGWYQDDGERTTWAAIGQVTGQYNIKPRYFLAGFSAGAAFVQGFFIHYPESVQGVAILSAGVYRLPFPLMGGGTPVLIVIGDRDDPVAIDGSRQFDQALVNNGLDVSYWLLPGVGHQVTDKARQLTIDLFHACNP